MYMKTLFLFLSIDCSCDPSCTEHENCCFPGHLYSTENQSSYTEHVKIMSENDTTMLNECSYALSTQPNVGYVKIQHQSFWMISEIKYHGSQPETQKCGSINVAPWGSLLPVSSRKTGHIYKNIHCANENFVKDEDVVNWEAAYVCDVKSGKIELTESFIDTCLTQFYPPKEIPIQRSSFCFNNLIDTCSDDVFKIPNEINMNHSEVINACTSGFISPYRVVDMYANIFCHICNGYHKAASYKCRILSYSSGGRFLNKISGLIDSSYLKNLATVSRNREKSTQPKTACLNKDVVFKSVKVLFYIHIEFHKEAFKNKLNIISVLLLSLY